MSYPTTYQPAGSRPGSGPSPGAKALMTVIVARFPGATNLGIYNPRDVCGHPWPKVKCPLSQHATGRACDFGIPPRYRRHLGDTIVAHLTAHAAELGITEVIWWHRRWTRTGGWRKYTGRSPHEDHIHTTLHPDAAARLTAAQVNATFAPPPLTPTETEHPLANLTERQQRELMILAEQAAKQTPLIVTALDGLWLVTGAGRWNIPSAAAAHAYAVDLGARSVKWPDDVLAAVPLIGD